MSFFDFDSFVPRDPRMVRILERGRTSAVTQVNILITGARGTGKSSLAHWLQRLHRGSEPLVALTPFDLGQAAGSHVRKCFLVENIDSWTLAEQQALFDVLDANSTTVQLIATSRRDLRLLARQGLFLPELFYRLAIMHFHLPPLSERADDLEKTARFLLDVNGILLSKPNLSLHPDALKKLESWSWPGNIFELENVISRAAAVALGHELQADDIEFDGTESVGESISHVGMKLCDVEKKLILQTLELTAQNRTKAAEILGISVRTLRNKINEYKEASHHESL